MNPTILDRLVETVASCFVDRPVTRVLPSGRSGALLLFGGQRAGLRLETWPPPGVVFPSLEQAPRLKGGRGAWPDLVGAADSGLAGHRLSCVRVGRRPETIRLEFEEAGALSLARSARSGVLVLDLAGQPRRTLPNQIHPPPDAPESFCEVNPARPITEVGGGALVIGPAGFRDGDARASWSGRLRVIAEDMLRSAAQDARAFPSVGAAVEEWWRLSAAAADLAGRAGAVSGAVRRELNRCRRALAAVQQEDQSAPAPEDLRHRAEALLAAGPAGQLTSENVWRAPDPYDPAVWLEIPAVPPGAPAHRVAERLFERARKIERGRDARCRRAAELAHREARLAEVLAIAGAADRAEDIARLEEAGRDAGLLPGPRPAPKGPRRAGEEAGPARVFRSPGGFEVLVGRSSRQNERLTFGVAAPDDYWLHAKGWAGAHVVLRCGNQTAPAADLQFAAGLAAAYSQAPAGELVDVHIARRKHVRKVRGGPAGAVTVRKSNVVRVRATRNSPERAN